MDNVSHSKMIFPFLISFLLTLACFGAQAETIPFDSPRWQLANAQLVDHLGQKALMGTALLKDAEFADGVIEFDLAVTGARSYPGILFRTRQDGSWSVPVNLGPGINSQGMDLYPIVSADGKYLFFLSRRGGESHTWWVQAKVIEGLKPKRLQLNLTTKRRIN